MLTRGGCERGATAVLIAALMFTFVGFAAIAIDLSNGFNQRRQTQTAADMGAMAGAVEGLRGGTAVVNQVLLLVDRNLTNTYDAAQYQSIWEQCVDPASERNTQTGDRFLALSAPPGWSPVDPTNWCISADGVKNLLRVRVPDQLLNTTFGRALGANSLRVNAAAVSELELRGPGGIIPFGLANGTPGGAHICLSSGPSGLAVDPCDGSTTGNFGTLKVRQYGNPTLGTTENCTASPLGNTLAQNIAVGIDHLVVTKPDTNTATEVRDQCFNAFVDTLNTDTGFPGNGAEEGLVGPVPGGFTARLKKVGPFEPIVNNHSVNDSPLWSYLLPQTSGGDGFPDYQGTQGPANAPEWCDPESFAGPYDFDGNGVPDSEWDFDGDGIPDLPASWQHMEACFQQYVGGGYNTVIFSETLLNNTARFSYVPQFWQATLGTGNSWNHILRFNAIYLQATIWKKGNTYVAHSPGEPCSGCTGTGWAMKQLTAFTFPDSALPERIRGNPPPGATST
jgi:hypothetical protein